MLIGGTAITEAKPENLRALMEAFWEYSVYHLNGNQTTMIYLISGWEMTANYTEVLTRNISVK